MSQKRGLVLILSGLEDTDMYLPVLIACSEHMKETVELKAILIGHSNDTIKIAKRVIALLKRLKLPRILVGVADSNTSMSTDSLSLTSTSEEGSLRWDYVFDHEISDAEIVFRRTIEKAQPKSLTVYLQGGFSLLVELLQNPDLASRFVMSTQVCATVLAVKENGDGVWEVDQESIFPRVDDPTAANSLLAFMQKDGVCLRVVEPSCVAKVPLSYTQQWSSNGNSQVVSCIARAQLHHATSLYQALHTLPEHYTKAWFFQELCGMSDVEYAKDREALDVLETESELAPLLKGSLRLYEAAALLVSLPDMERKISADVWYDAMMTKPDRSSRQRPHHVFKAGKAPPLSSQDILAFLEGLYEWTSEQERTGHAGSRQNSATDSSSKDIRQCWVDSPLGIFGTSMRCWLVQLPGQLFLFKTEHPHPEHWRPITALLLTERPTVQLNGATLEVMANGQRVTLRFASLVQASEHRDFLIEHSK